MGTARTPVALAILAVLYAGPVHADIFRHEASLTMSVSLDSNPALAPDDGDELWRHAIRPAYRFSRVQGPDTWQGGLSVLLERSSDPAASAGREDPSLSLSWQRELPRGGYGVSAKYEESSTRTTELLDTGLVTADATRTSSSLSANWNAELDQRNSLTLNASYQRAAYRGGSFTDYGEIGGGATFAHAWDARTEPYLRYAVSRYMPDSAADASSSHTAAAGVKLAFSETLSGDFQAGMSRIEGQGGSGLQGVVALKHMGRRSNWSLDAGRSTSASGAGAYVESDYLNAVWSYALSEKVSAGIDLGWRKNRSETAPAVIRQFSAWSGRELNAFWMLRVSYQYKQIEQAGLADVSAHVLGLSLSYSHPDFLDL